MLLGYSNHAEMILPGELALWIEYGANYIVLSFSSEFGYHVIIQKNLYVPSLIRFFTMVSCSYFHNRLHGTSILNWTRAFFWSEVTLAECANSYDTQNAKSQRVVIAIVSATSITKFHFGKWAVPTCH